MRYTKFANDFFIKNRDKVVDKLLPKSVALLFGAHQMPRNGDQYFPYRQNSDFFYLTGIEQEKSILLLTNETSAKELQQVLFILKPNKNMEIWEGHKLTIEEAREISGIKSIRYIDDFDILLHSILCNSDNIYFNFLELAKFKPDVNSRDQDNYNSIKADYSTHTFKRLAPILQEIRLLKSHEEIEKIRKACSITRDAFIRVLRSVQPGMQEHEIEAHVSFEFIRQGASGHAYAPIIAGGKNACILHYIENCRELENGKLMLMDFGAEYSNYSADLSRTIPINGKFTQRQKEIYEATLRVFRFAKSQMKEGTTINNYHKEVCKFWEEEHIRLGLYTQKEADKNQPESPLWFKYYMHGTGHFMGLDVHDVGTRWTVLKPGMVLTCEPGIYIPEEEIGVRIENDILITEDGNMDLMEDIPIEIEEIEDLMKKR